MKATEELKKEHEGIELMLQVLKAISEKIGRGEELPDGHLDDMIEFFIIFIDKCHHGKEEEFLFPALEDVNILREGGPIGVMLNEHEQGRILVGELKKALAKYKTGDKTVMNAIQNTSFKYIDLLTQHIAKENTVLFPMADAKLDPKKDSDLIKAFEQLEHDRIGIGRHEEFHALLNHLQKVYLD